MKTKSVGVLLLGFLVLLTACRTTNIEGAKAISIPANLTAKDAKVAMMASVSNESWRDHWKNWEKMTDSALSAAFGLGYQRQYRGHGTWYLESVEPAAVVFGYSHGKYYMRVRMQIDGSRIVPTIEDSTNLRQSGDSIHKTAIEWLNGLEVRIRSSLGQVSSLKGFAETSETPAAK